MYNRGVIMNNEEKMIIYNWANSNLNKMKVLLYDRLDYMLLPEDTFIPPIIFEINHKTTIYQQLSMENRKILETYYLDMHMDFDLER